MNKFIKIGSIALAAGLLFTSCAGQLNVTNPNSLNDDQIADLLKNGTDAQVEQILIAIGSGLESNVCLRDGNMYGGYTNFSYDSEYVQNLFRDLQCEDIVLGESSMSKTGWAVFYTNSVDCADYMENAWNYGWWYSSSKIIANANKPATYLTDEIAGPDDAKPAIKTYAAQAKTIRAYGYLLLMERFRKSYLHGGKEQQGMPIYTKYAYNPVAAPETADDTWNWIIKELQTASEYFAKGTNSATDGYTTDTEDGGKREFYDVDRTISDYLLARAAMNVGKYDIAIAACQEILKHYPNFIDEAHYGVKTALLDALATLVDESDPQVGAAEALSNNNAFLTVKGNPECMFGWLAGSGNTYTWSLMNTLSPSTNKTNTLQISEALYNKIDDNDYRKDIFTHKEIEAYPYLNSENGLSTSTVYKYSSLKWGATLSQGSDKRDVKSQTLADVVLLRSSEVWLMLAESQYMAGKETDAKTTLNKLLAARTKAGAAPLTCDTYKGGLSTLDLIKLQWRIEMWGEGGLNYYCHKRWNTSSVREAGNHWEMKGWDVKNMEWEIPYREISTNPNWK